MAVPLPQMLHPAIVNERVSRLIVRNDTLQSAFGFGKGGGAVRRTPSRRGSYDVFNDTREVASARLPGTHSATIPRQAVGNVPFTVPRTAEKMPIPMEEVNQLRAIGGPVDGVDELGERYLMDQEKIAKQRVTNMREFQTAAMLRGSYTYTQSGDDLTHGFSGGAITINYQIPSGNKTQLNMVSGGNIIGTAWDNSSAPIVRDCLAVNSAFNQLVGRGLTDIWCTSVVWGFVITNTEVQNLAGAVNDPLQNFTRDEGKQEFTATLRGCPWVTWHITDNGLNLSGTFTKLIEDTAAAFLAGAMDSDIVNYYVCPEPVVDPVSQAISNQYDEYYYFKFCDDPVVWEFHSRMNGLPVLKIPGAIAYGTVDF